jgi:hypothetical protein
MRHFINLTSRVINKSHIIEIVKETNKYEIHMITNYFSGSHFYGSGYISSDKNIIDICEKENKQDYDIITDLIKNGF